jgi:hypothetical protein
MDVAIMSGTPATIGHISYRDISHLEDLHELIKGIAAAFIGRMDDHDLLVRLNTRSEMTFLGVTELKTTIEAKQRDLDSRLRALEESRWRMLGAAGMVGAIASAVITYLKHG